MEKVLVNTSNIQSQQKLFVQHHVQSRHSYSYQQINKQPIKQLNVGDRLYKTGQEASFIYIVNQGFVKTVVHASMGRDRIIDVYGPGEIIGSASLEAAAHVESVMALTSVAVTPIDPHYALSNGAFSKYLSSTLARQLLRYRESIDDAALPVGARLCKKLIRLGERFGNVVQVKNQKHLQLPFSLTQEEYASAIGSSRITVARIFSYLRSTGAVVGKRGNFVVRLELLEQAIDTYVLEVL